MKKEKNKERKPWKRYQKVLVILGAIFVTLVGIFLFLLYGPWSWFRETLITSAMTTMNHQYLATWFYDDKTIQEVLKKHYVESLGNSNPNLIEMKEYGKNKSYASKYEKDILEHDEGALYKLIPISGVGYQGHLVAIYDPSKVKIATTRYLGERGESILTVAKNNNAVVALNGGGFYDPDWNSNGAQPHGTVIQDGKIVSDFYDAPVGGGFVGFNRENKLILGHYSKEEALEIGLRDAVEFGPFLIVDGKAAFVKGNGGWGIAPRTAIGQRKDGIVLFLAIDGRLATSIGADMVDLTEVMKNYGAYNAANMDGGSSTELVIRGEIINHPVASGNMGLRDMPTFWIVTE